MKITRIAAVALAVMLLTAGCATRNRNNVSSNVETPGQVASSIREEISRIESHVEEGVSRLEEDFGASRYEDDLSRLDEDRSRLDEDRSEDFDFNDDMTSESIAAAMSTDFKEIGALDGSADNGFPGGPVDEQNRPSGPIGYQQKYGKYDAFFIIPDSQKIYLTFDEGYENGYTGKILDVLKEKGVKAVFFVTYPYAEQETDLMRRIVEEGHTLGNHSTAHKNFPSMTLEEAAEDIMKLHNYVKAQYGYEMFLFRPPEGSFSEQTLALTQSLGYKTVLWSFAHRDWEVDNQPLTVEALELIRSKTHPGEIMLLHAVSKTNTEILGDLIDTLRTDGFEFADYFNFVRMGS